MAVLIDKTKKRNPVDASVKYYPVVKTIEQVDEHEVARLIADETTLNPMEAEMVIAQLSKVLANLLLSGHSVKIGSLGSISLSVSGEGVEKEADVSPALIKKVNVNFRFSPDFKAKIAKVSFVPVSRISSEQSDSSGE